MSMQTPLGRVRGLGPARSGTSQFWWQRLTAVANIFLTLCSLLFSIVFHVGRRLSCRARLSRARPLSALA